MYEFRVWIGSRLVGTVRADDYTQAVGRARVKYRFGPYARVRVNRTTDY